ncbi:MAG: LicD family protein [Eubacterium sp.]|nr:LicD family protein [Eubacterium sp.]
MNNILSDFDKLKVVELNILKEIVRICEKHGIKYYLAYGTLIGAIRHKGFIPWDDDIDIWMFREDYEKFAKIAPKELGEEFFYQDWKTEKEYPYNFAKVRMNGTEFKENLTNNMKMHQGIWVDIFPLDKEREDITDKEILKFHERAKRIRTIIELPLLLKVKDKTIYRIIGKLLYLLVPYNYLHNKLLKMETEFNKTDSDIYSFKMDEVVNRFNSGDFGDGIMAEFEGEMFRIPKNYDKVLRIEYGDYMQLPPVEKRVTNHTNKGIDFGNLFD